MRFDVVIVGAGMAGLTFASFLARFDYNIALIDKNKKDSLSISDKLDPRVIAISSTSQKIFQATDIWQTLPAHRVTEFHAMRVWDTNSEGEIAFTGSEFGLPCLGYIIENHVLGNALRTITNQYANIHWFAPTTVESIEHLQDSVCVRLDDDTRLNTNLVVGADGTHSRVRELAGMEYSVTEYNQRSVVFLVEVERSHQDTAWQCFLRTGPVALLPCAFKHCATVWSADNDYAHELLHMNDATLSSELTRLFSERVGTVTAQSKRYDFPLRGGIASSFCAPRIALIGDAAHTIHPLAGQGANLGFYDAAQLVNELIATRDPTAWRGLRAYERARKGDTLVMKQAMEGFYHLFGNSSSLASWLRGSGLRFVDRCAPVKHWFLNQALGPERELQRVLG